MPYKGANIENRALLPSIEIGAIRIGIPYIIQWLGDRALIYII